jgi:translation elongation factor EF-1alpha
MTEEKKEKEIGKVTHYFDRAGVAVINLTASLKVGDKIRIKGHTTDFEQDVVSMQVEHNSISEGKKGEVIGIKVDEKVRDGDIVLKK